MAAATRRIFEAANARNDDRFTAGDWAVFAGVSLIWGASFLLIDIGLDALSPGMITFARVAGGAVTLLALTRLRAGRFPIPDAADARRIAVLGVVWVAVPFTLFPLAEQRINSAVTGLLNGSTPVFVAVIAIVAFGQRTRGAQLLGIVVGLAGVVLISLPSLDEGASQAVGVLLVVAATFCYGVAMNIAAPLQHAYGSVTVMGWVLGVATILTLPFAAANLADNRLTAGPVLAVLVLGVVGTGIAFALMGSLIARVGPSRASFITYLIPVVALVLGVTFRGDAVAPIAVAGVVLVIAGAILASRPAKAATGPGQGVRSTFALVGSGLRLPSARSQDQGP